MKKRFVLMAVIALFLLLGFLGMILQSGFSQQDIDTNNVSNENKTLEELEKEHFDQKFSMFISLVDWLKKVLF